MQIEVVVAMVLAGVLGGLVGYIIARRSAPPQPVPLPQQQVLDPAAYRQQRIENARQRRAALERQVAEEENLLFEEEERDFLLSELKQLREATRQAQQTRRKQPPQQGP